MGQRFTKPPTPRPVTAPVVRPAVAAATPMKREVVRTVLPSRPAAPAHVTPVPAARVAAQRPVAAPPQDNYGDTHLDIDRLREDYQHVGAAAEFYELQTGRNVVRFLPNPTGSLFYAWGLQVFIPNADGAGNGGYFISPKTKDSDAYCPVASIVDKLHRQSSLAGDPGIQSDARKLADALTPREIFLSNVLVQQPDGSGTVCVMRYKRSVYRALAAYVLNSAQEADPETASETVNIAHPVTGVKVAIEKSGQGMKTRYNTVITAKQQPVGPDVLAARVDVEARMASSDVSAIEEALLNLFGIDDFAYLIDPDTPIELPILEDRSQRSAPQARTRVAQATNVARAQRRTLAPATAQQRRAAVPVAQAVEEEQLVEDDDDLLCDPAQENGGALYQCFGAHGNPEVGLDCATCELTGECEQTTIV